MMLISEAFTIALRSSKHSTEDLRIAQHTLEYTKPESSATAVLQKIAAETIGEELAERNNRVRQARRLTQNLNREMKQRFEG